MRKKSQNTINNKNTKKKFDYRIDFKKINFREHPELYKVGKGEQGVLLIEPYKSELLPHWRFKTNKIAKKSSTKIYQIFLQYKLKKDFVGMDVARKYLQMGFTRSRRYANHKTGRKYNKKTGKILPIDFDEEKALSAETFREKYLLVNSDEIYLEMKKNHQMMYG